MDVQEVLKKDWEYKSQRQRISPFPNYLSMEVMCDELKKAVGYSFTGVLMIIEQRNFNLFFLEKESKMIGTSLLEKVKKNPSFYRKLINKEDKFGKKLVNYCKRLYEQDISKKSNRELVSYYKGFSERYKQVYAQYGSVLIIDGYVHNELNNIIAKKIKTEDNEKIKEILNILTLQPKAMVAKIEKDELIFLAVKINNNQKWLGELQNREFADFSKGLKSVILKHKNNYFWVTRDYEDPIIDELIIVNRLKELIQSDLKMLVEKNKSENSAYINRKKEIENEMIFNKDEKNLFKTMLDISYLKEQRKKYVSASLYYFDSVLTQIAKKSNLSLAQIRFLTEDNIEDLLINSKDFSEEINNRIKLSVWYGNENGTQICTGDDAQKIKNHLIKQGDANIFKGEPVSPGKATGPVKIILNPDEINKVNKGDVIVSIQVVPSFSTGIQKAAALVCDGGHGITSHPAILAREAGIPAIIKTRNAHLLLKDGDIVEVDAYTGIVKKIS